MQIHLSCLILSSFLINWISGLDPLECRTDKQAFDYKGTLSTTISGKFCLSWSDKETIRLIEGWAPDWLPEEVEEAKEAKNYCRNMDEHSEGPYCFVAGAAPGTAVIEHCDVPFCPTTPPPTTTTAPTTLSPIPDYITRECSKALSLFSYPDVEDNKVYYVCEFPRTIFQKITKKQCPEGTVFDQWKKVCIHDKKHKASDHFNKLCITGNETFAHPTSCTKYLQCINLFSSPVVRSCPIGTVVTKLGNCEMKDHSDVSDRCAESGSKTDSIEDETKEDNDQQIQDDDQQEQDDTKKDDDLKREKRNKHHKKKRWMKRITRDLNYGGAKRSSGGVLREKRKKTFRASKRGRIVGGE